MRIIGDYSKQLINKASSAVRREASRCLFCYDAPCEADCPVGIDVPGFIRRLMQDNLQGAYQLIHQENPLPWICGVLCPTEKMCASHCPRRLMDKAVDIGGLQAHVSERNWPTPLNGEKQKNANGKVAIVGAGPAGLTAALYLSRKGLTVDLFEAEESPGGLIIYGIRPDKVDKKRALQEIENLLASPGISINLKVRISDPYDLLKEYKAVYVATGLGREKINEKHTTYIICGDAAGWDCIW